MYFAAVKILFMVRLCGQMIKGSYCKIEGDGENENTAETLPENPWHTAADSM